MIPISTRVSASESPRYLHDRLGGGRVAGHRAAGETARTGIACQQQSLHEVAAGGVLVDPVLAGGSVQQQIELVALATAKGLRMVATAVKEEGGQEAVSLRIAEQYVAAFEKVAKESTTMLLPNGLSDIGGAVAGLQKVLKTVDKTPA